MRVLAMGAVCLLLACAGSSSSTSTARLTPEDQLLFDNAIDMVTKPAIVESEWRGDFERRVTRSDAIAVVHVESLSSDEDLRGSGYRLTTGVVEKVKGKTDRELVLRVHDDEAGFRSVRANENRLLGKEFVAFIKWENDPELGQLVPRWHLSPNSAAVRDKVTFFMSPPPTDDRTQVEVVQP